MKNNTSIGNKQFEFRKSLRRSHRYLRSQHKKQRVAEREAISRELAEIAGETGGCALTLNFAGGSL